MYKFKTIDYRLSNQEYIFSLISMLEEGKYDFVYIPYSEFPALLMLDYILATNPHKFNADIFDYFKEAGKTERFGHEDILIISEDLVDRRGIVSKLGFSIKDVHLTQIQEQIRSGRKQGANGGRVLDLTVSDDSYKDIDILENIFGINKEVEIVVSDILSFSRYNEESSNLLDAIYLGDRPNEDKGVLIDGRVFEKEAVLDSLIRPLEATRVEYTYGILHDIVDMVGEDRVGEVGEIIDFTKETRVGLIPYESILADTINQFEGLILELDTYTRDYLEVNIVSIEEGYREYSLKGDINYYTLADRFTYVYIENHDDYILASRPNELEGTIVDFQGDFERYYNAEMSNINMFVGYESQTEVTSILKGMRPNELEGYFEESRLFKKETKASLVSAIGTNREGGGEGSLEILTIFNKDDVKEVILESVITSSEETEKLAELSYFRVSESDAEYEIGLVHTIYSDLMRDRYGVELVHEKASKYVLDKVALENLLYGIKESIGTGVIETIYILDRDGGHGSRYIISLLGGFINEREATLEDFHIGNRFDERLSILIPDLLVDTDKEKDAILELSLLVDKEKDVFLHEDEKFIREFLPSGYIWYAKDSVREKHGEGILEFLFNSTKELGYDAVTDLVSYYGDYGEKGILEFSLNSVKELGYDAVIDLVNYYGNYEEDRQVYILQDSSIDSREVGGKGVKFDLVFSTSNNLREGKYEYLIEAVEPRKKLLKSWLDEFRRDGDKDLTLDFYARGVRDGSRDLERYYMDVANRYLRKDLEIYDSLDGGQIKRRNKLDRDTLIEDVIVPITKLLDKDTTVVDGEIYRLNPLLKFNLDEYDYGKDGFIDYSHEFFEKFKEAFKQEQEIGQGLMYDYSDILEEGMDVEHWEVGYAIPEDYDPLDPFNPYYPWAEERNDYSLVQAEEWEQVQGDWELDKSNATIKANEGGGILVTKKHYGDFKFKFRTQLGYMPDCRTGFIFRYDDINNYYKFTLSSGNTPFELVQVIDGRERKIASPIAPFFMDGGSWHVVDISLVEDRLTIYVDGRLQYDLILES